MDDEHKKSTEKLIEEIFRETGTRQKAGGNSLDVGWQDTLEMMLLTMEKRLRKQPGQLLPMQINNQEEWEFYLNIQKKFDLPPNTSATLITPGAFKEMAFPRPFGIESGDITSREGNSYLVIISGSRDYRVIMGISLSDNNYAEIGVFADGKLLADYAYNTTEECLTGLTKIIWIHFGPEDKWTEENIVRYTENWFAKSINIDIEDVVVHSKYSYIHRPELLNLTSLESVFKVIEATIPREYDSLEKAIKTANKISPYFILGDPFITREGILQDDKYECELFLDRIRVEIDKYLNILECLRDIKFPHRSSKSWEYKRIFGETAVKVYEAITGRPYPRPINDYL